MSDRTTGTPYLDFYTAHKIAPVHQDISDESKHFERRESLYRQLGIVPSLLSGASVIEFGPGPGFNALYTASLLPKRYVLVDGNERSLERLRENVSNFKMSQDGTEIVNSNIEKFSSDERFDLVLCEGVIPWQLAPRDFVRHISQFVKPGGTIVVTCIDSVSFLGESLRRILACKISPYSDPMEKRLSVLEPFFTSQLVKLKGMSRPVRDWIQDNILIKYYGRFFSFRDAIEALDDSFDFYQSAPHFVSDWRWYKTLVGTAREFNVRARVQYLSQLMNFLDYRFTVPSVSPELGETLLQLGEDIFDCMLHIEEQGMSVDLISEATTLISSLGKLISAYLPETAKSFEEVCTFLRSPSPNAHMLENHFSSFFGRGQQYVSLIRSAD